MPLLILMKTIPEALVGRQGPHFKTVPTREHRNPSPEVLTMGPARVEANLPAQLPLYNEMLLL